MRLMMHKVLQMSGLWNLLRVRGLHLAEGKRNDRRRFGAEDILVQVDAVSALLLQVMDLVAGEATFRAYKEGKRLGGLGRLGTCSKIAEKKGSLRWNLLKRGVENDFRKIKPFALFHGRDRDLLESCKLRVRKIFFLAAGSRKEPNFRDTQFNSLFNEPLEACGAKEGLRKNEFGFRGHLFDCKNFKVRGVFGEFFYTRFCQLIFSIDDLYCFSCFAAHDMGKVVKLLSF